MSAHRIFLLIAQAMSDRLIVAERALGRTKNILDRERTKGLCMQEAVEVQPRPVEDLTLIEHTMSVASALCFLTRVLEDSGPLDMIQNFAHLVLKKCAKPGSDDIDLKWLRSVGTNRNIRKGLCGQV